MSLIKWALLCLCAAGAYGVSRTKWDVKYKRAAWIALGVVAALCFFGNPGMVFYWRF